MGANVTGATATLHDVNDVSLWIQLQEQFGHLGFATVEVANSSNAEGNICLTLKN